LNLRLVSGMDLRVVALMVSTAACGVSDTHRWEGVVRDSGGIRIIENRGRGVWSESSAWQVRDRLSVGNPEGEEEYLFGRIADVAVDSRDRLHVLDAATRDVRVFDGGGVFVHRVGGPGRGPGELSKWANAVLLGPGDTVYVPDYAVTRINVYGPDGDYVREIGLYARPGGRSWERLDGTHFMFRGLTIGRDEAGRFTTSDDLFVTTGAGAPLDTILTFDYPASPLGVPGEPVVPLIVNGALWCRLADGRIAWTSLDRDEVLITDPAGHLDSIVRSSEWTRSLLTRDDRLAMKERLRQKLSLLGGDAGSVDRLELVYDETLPAITDLRAGPDSTLWVQRMGSVAGIDPMAINASDATGWLGDNVWSVLDASGRLLGDITMPGRVRITRITADAVYGVRKDENDVEHVVRLDLSRSGLPE
jgi:6-bladed beta-propeller